MKKLIILMGLLMFTATGAFAGYNCPPPPDGGCPPPPPCGKMGPPPPDFKGKPGPDHEKRKAEFEKRIQLTDAQKEQAKQIRQKGFEEMKPIMVQMKTLREKKEALIKKGQTNSSPEVAKINEELRALHKQAHEIRKKNAEEFESILTKNQLKELNKMKEERKKAMMEHKKNCKNPNCPCKRDK